MYHAAAEHKLSIAMATVRETGVTDADGRGGAVLQCVLVDWSAENSLIY